MAFCAIRPTPTCERIQYTYGECASTLRESTFYTSFDIMKTHYIILSDVIMYVLKLSW